MMVTDFFLLPQQEKEFEACQRVKAEGVSVNEKTYAEMEMIAEFTGTSQYLPSYL